MADTLWAETGKSTEYEHRRTTKSTAELRKWTDEAYYNKNLRAVLDNDFPARFRDHDFFSRLWELELADWLYLANLSLIPTNGVGPDFCVELSDGRKIWIEAVLATAGAELDELWRSRIAAPGELSEAYDFPKQETALRYGNSLVEKGDHFNPKDGKYNKFIGPDDFSIIAVSGFPPGALASGIEHFLRAALPMGDPVVHFTTDGSPLDPSVTRATHTDLPDYIKPNGSTVLKQFLYPGTYFPFVDAVLFTEASNLQQLLGTYPSSFDDSTNIPHIFPNFASQKPLPAEFTDNFYLHEFVDGSPMMSLRTIEPIKKLM